MSDQTIKPDQELTETWTVTYVRPGVGYTRDIEARLWWPHNTIYALSGKGRTVEEARLDLALRLAAAIADDPSAEPPASEESVHRLLNASRRGLRARRNGHREEALA